jgi:hypothetical protein
MKNEHHHAPELTPLGDQINAWLHAAGAPTVPAEPPEAAAPDVAAWLQAYQAIPPADRVGRATQVLSALRVFGDGLREEYPVVLRGGLALVLALRDRTWEILGDVPGQPPYPNAAAFKAAFARWSGLSDNPGRLGRIVRSAELWLAIAQDRPDLPLPLALSRLEPLLHLPPAAAVTVYGHEVLVAGGTAPTYAQLAAWDEVTHVRPAAASAEKTDPLQAAYTLVSELQAALNAGNCDWVRWRADVQHLATLLAAPPRARSTAPRSPRPNPGPTTAPGVQPNLAVEERDSTLVLRTSASAAYADLLATLATRRGWRAAPDGTHTYPLSAAPALRRQQVADQRAWVAQLGPRLAAPAQSPSIPPTYPSRGDA